jgi:hypothetical protein
MSFSLMYSRSRHEASNTMTRKTKQRKGATPLAKIQSLEKKLSALSTSKKPKQKPFSAAGSIVGKSIGSMFGNANTGSKIGKWLGSGIGSIFGSGDYTLMGPQPSYNVLTNSTQIPQFSQTRQSTQVCHREYLGDINGTAGFNNTSYPLNPGVAGTFPWLATVAQNFQEYKFHGLIFEFRPLITDFVTNGAPGVVVMATNYNADSPVYTSKQQMENSEFAVSVKPTNALIHGVECKISETILPHRYIRSGAVPANQDLRLYDYGNFQFATQANPVQDLGELWVSYCVELLKPILPLDIGGDVSSNHTYRTLVSGLVSPLGANSVTNVGSLAVTSTPTTISWFAQPQQQYFVTFMWTFGSAAFIAPGFSITGLSFQQYFAGDTGTNVTAPTAGGTTTQGTITFIFKCILLNPGNVVVTANLLGSFGALTTVDIIVTELDNAITT